MASHSHHHHHHHMDNIIIKFVIILILIVTFVSSDNLSKTVLYQAPDECRWSGVTDIDIVLICHLRTINSELENTNFSVIQPQNTIRLRLECNDGLFFQSSLSAGSFKNLIELRSLTIEYCKLGNLTEGSFHGLKDLTNLTIRTHNSDWSSMSMNIGMNVFNDFHQLEYLDLTKNNIWFIPKFMICPLKTLKFLNISHNQIQTIENLHLTTTQNHEICGKFLITLDLSYNKITNLPTTIFSGLRNLKYLYLKNNDMLLIADRAFENLIALELIDLSENQLKNLPPELFMDTKFIKSINLHNNSMNILAPGLFIELTELLKLDLSNNHLNSQWINSETFQNLKKLILLNLSYNKIEKLQLNIFENLINLQILKLNHNFIDTLPNYIFKHLMNLQTLILSNNLIQDIHQYTLNGLINILILSLDYNHIKNIHENTFENCTNLQDLHLNNNQLQHIPKAFKQLLLLKTLDLGDNMIKTLNNTSIIQLENLYGLRLTDNYINLIEKNYFIKMTSLQILNLSKNKIHNIEENSFANNKQLQAIRLDGNFIKNITNLFQHLPNLVWLNISDNYLEKFYYTDIPINLEWLDIHSNQINQLCNYLDIKNELLLNTFDLSSNSLIEITTTSIPNNIKILYLNDNLINKIQPYTFFKKLHLQRVDLYGNKLLTLEPNALRLSPIPIQQKLPEFYIGGNLFQCNCHLDWLSKINIETRTQPKLMDLSSIYCQLAYNRKHNYLPLIETKSNEFLCQYEKHCLALCYCCDFYACDCKMECPSQCQCYHDQSWTSNIVDCSNSNYKNQLPIHIPMDATQLYLDGNYLIELNSHIFLGHKRLKILYLNHSHVEVIMNRTFYGLLELEILQLNHNNLKNLYNYEFHGLDNLKELYLNHNQLMFINNYTFVNLNQLKLLYLDHNNIIEFYGWNYLPNSITILQLSKNPWLCHCNMLNKLLNFMNLNAAALDLELKINDLEEINCNYNENLYKNLHNYTQQNNVIPLEILLKYYQNNETTLILCDKHNQNTQIHHKHNHKNMKNILKLSPYTVENYIPILMSILGSIIFIIIFILFIFIYRQEIRIWFYAHFNIRIFYNTNLDIDKNERDKLYDAFISYSIQDEQFVLNELITKLERNPHDDATTAGSAPTSSGYKLFLYYRDYPIGSYINDTIIQSIDSSRRTIMILSENYLKSEWCRFEFKSAHHQVLRDRKKRLIVIIIGELLPQDLDPDIRLYLKTNTYLQWGDKLFWQKLRFALPDLPLNNQHQRQHNNYSHIPMQQQQVAIPNRNLQHFNVAPRANLTRSNNNNNQMIMMTQQQQQQQQNPTTTTTSSSSSSSPRTVAMHI